MPQDDPDPPRKFYGFKAPQYDQVNPLPVAPPPDPSPAPDPGPAPLGTGRIDVHDLARLAQRADSPLGTNAVQNRANEVHEMLRINLERDRAAGLFDVEPSVDKKRRRRIINYWTLLILVDGFFGGVAILAGPGAAIPFVCAIAGLGMFTAWWTWETWFLRTD